MEKGNTISERFREVRKHLGLTQQQLADRMLLSRNYVAKIETERKVPSARIISALESLLVDRGHKGSGKKWTAHESEATNAADLESELRHLFEQSLAVAHGNDRRLIWMLEQVRAHLRPPAHWNVETPEHIEGHGVQIAKKLGEQDAFMKAGAILSAQAHGTQPKAKSS